MAGEYGNGYGTFDSLEYFLVNAEIGYQYYIEPDYSIYVSEFYFTESAQVWRDWFARKYFDADPESNPEGYDNADFEISENMDWQEVSVGPFYVVLMPDIYDDPVGSDGIYGVYVTNMDWWEQNGGAELDIIEISNRNQTYQDALNAGRSMYRAVNLDNFDIVELRFYDVLQEGDSTPVDSRDA